MRLAPETSVYATFRDALLVRIPNTAHIPPTADCRRRWAIGSCLGEWGKILCMNPHQELWDELGTEIGHLAVELNKIIEQLDAIEESVLTRDLIQIEFLSNRSVLIEKITTLERQIIDLQLWIRFHAVSVGSRRSSQSE